MPWPWMTYRIYTKTKFSKTSHSCSIGRNIWYYVINTFVVRQGVFFWRSTLRQKHGRHKLYHTWITCGGRPRESNIDTSELNSIDLVNWSMHAPNSWLPTVPYTTLTCVLILKVLYSVGILSYLNCHHSQNNIPVCGQRDQFRIKILSYPDMNPHYKDKAMASTLYFLNGNETSITENSVFIMKWECLLFRFLLIFY